MIFDSYVPMGHEEVTYYGNKVTIDQGGVDIQIDGETISGSFEGQKSEDIALAVLGEDYADEDQRAEHVVLLGAMNYEGYLNMGYIYLRAAQIIRATEESKRNLEAAA